MMLMAVMTLMPEQRPVHLNSRGLNWKVMKWRVGVGMLAKVLMCWEQGQQHVLQQELQVSAHPNPAKLSKSP